MQENKPKIVTLDIETAPITVWSWVTRGKQWNAIETIVDWNILSVSIKWLGKKPEFYCLADFKGYKPQYEEKDGCKIFRKPDDKQLALFIRDILDEADIVIGQNSDAFDIKKINSRLMVHGILPPSPYKQIDTLKIKRRVSRSSSNKLDDMGEELGLGRKVKHEGFPLWVGVMKGDKKAIAKMKKYNNQDVILTEKVYLFLRPWDKSHPNLNKYTQTEHSCPVCSSFDLQRRGTEKTSGNINIYQRWCCKSCGKWSRSRIAEKDIIKPSIV